MKRLRTPASPALFQRDDVVRWDIGCAERSVGSRLTFSSVMTGTNAPTENITSLRRRLFAHSRCSTLVNSVLVDLKFIADPGPSNRRERHLPGTSHYSICVKCFGSRSTSAVTNSTKRIASCSNCSVVEPRFLSRFSLALRITALHMSETVFIAQPYA